MSGLQGCVNFGVWQRGGYSCGSRICVKSVDLSQKRNTRVLDKPGCVQLSLWRKTPSLPAASSLICQWINQCEIVPPRNNAIAILCVFPEWDATVVESRRKCCLNWSATARIKADLLLTRVREALSKEMPCSVVEWRAWPWTWSFRFPTQHFEHKSSRVALQFAYSKNTRLLKKGLLISMLMQFVPDSCWCCCSFPPSALQRARLLLPALFSAS